MSVEERNYWVQWFCNRLCQIQEGDFYWHNGRCLARVVGGVRAQKKVPDGAVFIGRFRHPYSGVEFVRHLEEVA